MDYQLHLSQFALAYLCCDGTCLPLSDSTVDDQDLINPLVDLDCYHFVNACLK